MFAAAAAGRHDAQRDVGGNRTSLPPGSRDGGPVRHVLYNDYLSLGSFVARELTH
jgi:hypothetical protein